MNNRYPIYTEDAECQDCYKCVRRCLVKAIRVRDGRAAVIPENCIGCGRCVEVCPAHAKRVRSDLGRIKMLLRSDKPVYVSLAPSHVSEYHRLQPGQLIAALRRLGFAGVGETAVGAQLVSAAVAAELNRMERGVVISSACPAAADFIRKYLPQFAGAITPVLSPVMAHARYLRDRFGDDIAVVFVGPCIAKKTEADRHEKLLTLALTYPELNQLLQDHDIDPCRLTPGPEDHFVPEKAAEGALYPIEGGMIETIRPLCRNQRVRYASISGIGSLALALEGLSPDEVEVPVFIETLACGGGCVHGPQSEHRSPGLLERLRILESAVTLPEIPPRSTPGDFSGEFPPDPVPAETVDDAKLREALHRIGKFRPEDELNCGGCGYDSCREFARALIAGNGENAMCVSYMRKLAQKKANALLRCMPAGVAVVDKNLAIVECNRMFAELLGPDCLDVFDACPGMAGADLRRMASFAPLFLDVIESGSELKRDYLKVGDHLFNLTIFPIEAGAVAGAVIFDVTHTELHRSEIAARAREVIDKNLAAVQEIACRLGEHMADTELLLRSIADDYPDEEISTPNPGNSAAPRSPASPPATE